MALVRSVLGDKVSEPLRVLDLFSGIGGFSLGLERTGGFRTVAFCEIEPYCRAVLRKHWPSVPCFEDVRSLRAEDVGAIDVICGGFPCQDVSPAGNRAGIDGEQSGLWREYARLVGEIRPRFVIVENTATLTGRGLLRILGDFAKIGFDAEWHCIPAAYVGARHIRDRIWIVAHPERIGREQAKQYLSAEFFERSRLSCSPWGSDGFVLGSQFGETWAAPDTENDRVAYGLPEWMDELTALGNAVVPQIPEIIGRAILEAEVNRH